MFAPKFLGLSPTLTLSINYWRYHACPKSKYYVSLTGGIFVSEIKESIMKQESVRPRWPYDMRPSVRAEKYMCVIVIR